MRGRVGPGLWLLPLLVAVGLLLRLIGLRWGFPLLLHPDEPSVVRPAHDMILGHTLDPGFFKRPNHFSIYLSALLYQPLSRLLLHKSFAVGYAQNPDFFYLVSRGVVAVAGTLSIIVGFFIGREFNARVGYLVGAAVAVLPAFVENSHYAAPDVTLTLLLMLVVLFCLRYLRRPSRANLGLALLSAATATIEKYPGVLSLLLILSVVVFAPPGRWQRRLLRAAAATCVFVAAVAVLSPYLIIRHTQVVADIINEARPTNLGADGLGWLGNLRFYAVSYYADTGLLLAVAMVAGLAYLVRRRDPRLLPLLFSFGFWIALGRVSLHWERWALPMYVGPLVLACIGVDLARRRLEAGRGARRRLLLLGTVGVAGVFASMGLTSLARSVDLSLTDTRVAALQYVRGAGITRAQTIYDGYTPFAPGTNFSALSMTGRARQDPGVRFVMISSSMYGRYMREPDRYPAEDAFYQRVMGMPLVAEFVPDMRTRTVQARTTAPRGWRDLLPEAKNAVDAAAFLAYAAGTTRPLGGPTIRIFRYVVG